MSLITFAVIILGITVIMQGIVLRSLQKKVLFGKSTPLWPSGVVSRSSCCNSMIISHEVFEECSFGETCHLSKDCTMVDGRHDPHGDGSPVITIGEIEEGDCTHYRRLAV